MKEIMIKVIVAGEPGSGKTIISEMNDACLPLRQLGVSIGLKTLEKEEAQCCFTFITWTLTKGRPKGTSYFKGTKAAVIVGDLTKAHTIKKMMNWAKSIKKSIGDIPLVFVGNNVENAEGSNVFLIQKIANSYSSPIVLTSLEDRDTFEEIFTLIVNAIGPKLWDGKVTNK